jgi:hypothetical protein
MCTYNEEKTHVQMNLSDVFESWIFHLFC